MKSAFTHSLELSDGRKSEKFDKVTTWTSLLGQQFATILVMIYDWHWMISHEP